MKHITITTIIFLSFNFFTITAQPPGDEGLEYARRLYEAGQYRAAQAQVEQILPSIPADRRQLREEAEFMLADCALRLGQDNARDLTTGFIEDNSFSLYVNDIYFSRGDLYFAGSEFLPAIMEFQRVDQYALPPARRPEYNFKYGYSLFMRGSPRQAQGHFRSAMSGGYQPHSIYYISYIDYMNGRYAEAKRGFNSLSREHAYAPVMPFYILQIEYLEGNYDYVTANGDRLLEAATGPRVAEIARVMSEAWFHKRDYDSALSYMNFYRTNGGTMGRSENYIAGYSLLVRGQYLEAANALSRVAGPDDKLTQNAAYHLGDAYLKAGDRREAMRAFSIAAASNYDPYLREEALFTYGKLQFELGGGVFNEAINVLTRYLQEYPSSPRIAEAREYLAAAYYNSRNYDAAYEAIKQIPDPDNNIRTAFQKISYFRGLEAYHDGRPEQALAMFDESLANRFNPKYTALTLFWKGELLYRQGDYRGAIPLLRDYLSLAPATEREYAMARYDLGYAYFMLGQNAEAVTWFDRFLKDYRPKDGFYADAWNRIGDVRYGNRDFNGAVRAYTTAASAGTNERFYSRFQSAMAQGLTDRPAAKIDALNAIISANEGPYVPDAQYELGHTYLTMGRYSDAARVLKSFIDTHPLAPQHTAALSDLGLVHLNMGDDRTALAYYKAVIEKAPASQSARDAMLAVRSLYIDMNDVDGYFAFAAASGTETDISVLERDSLTYAAAERVFLSSTSRLSAAETMKDYLVKFPRGVFRPNALYNHADASAAAGLPDSALESLRELASMSYNSFTVRGLERLASLLTEKKEHREAGEVYRELARVAINPQTVSEAYRKYLEQLAATGDDELLAGAAAEVASAQSSDADLRRYARYTEAQALDRLQRSAQAMSIYRELATESRTEEGANSTLRVIEDAFASGDTDRAQRMILEMAGSDTPHTYALGRAFLILGDIYIAKGDSFQARATLQSIVDGYSPSDDGVIQEARRKIENL